MLEVHSIYDTLCQWYRFVYTTAEFCHCILTPPVINCSILGQVVTKHFPVLVPMLRICETRNISTIYKYVSMKFDAMFSQQKVRMGVRCQLQDVEDLRNVNTIYMLCMVE